MSLELTSVEQYLNTLTEDADAGSYLEVTRATHNGERYVQFKGTAFPTTNSGLANAAQMIRMWDEDGYDLWAGAAPRYRKPTGQSGRALLADVNRLTHLWCDVDHDDAQASIDAFPVKPTMVVCSSGNKRHVYWRLQEAITPDVAQAAMRAIIKALKGDAACHNPDRILRIPQTHNNKPGLDSAEVTLLHLDDRKVSVDDLIAAAGPTDVLGALRDPAAPTAPSTEEVHYNKDREPLTPDEIERLDRVTGDTPARDRTKIREYSKRKLSHARVALSNAQTTKRGYGAMQLLGVARDIGRCLGGGINYADALRMLTDFQEDMNPETDEQRHNNQRSIARGLAQGTDFPYRPRSSENVSQPVSQDAAGGLRTSRNVTMVATYDENSGPGEQLFMDGAIKVKSVVGTEDEGVNQAYEIELTVGDKTLEQYIEVAEIANPQKLAPWTMARGLNIFSVPTGVPSGLNSAQRLNKFLISQGAPQSMVVRNLGWHAPTKTFLTMDGRITAAGYKKGFEGVRPHPHMVRQHITRHRYGNGKTAEEARAALREVLTWQHPMTSAIMGSWWATTFLKQHIRAEAGDGLYVFLGVQGNSGTGKTSGMLKSLLALSGAADKPLAGDATLAAVRTQLSGHNAGVVWLDDSDHVGSDDFWTLIRNSTSDADRVKMGEDNTTVASTPLTAAVVVSGEGLNVLGEKANEERCILLTPEDPTDRLGRDGVRPQWEDIQQYRRENPDLNEFAAGMVQLALQQEGLVRSLPKLTGGLPGRRGEKAAILRLGAKILAGMAGLEEGPLVALVEAWINSHLVEETRNIFESKFLTYLLDAVPPEPMTSAFAPLQAGKPCAPLLYDDDGLYVNIGRGIIWANGLKLRAGVGSVHALAEQAASAGCVYLSKNVSGGSQKRTKLRLWKIPEDMAERLGWGLENTSQKLHQLDLEV